jgi:glycosyltransferase involved in cell wall biosynthesis
MRVLVVSALYPPQVIGGAEITLAALCEGLAGRGHEITVLTVGGDAADYTTAAGVTVMRRRIPNLYPVLPIRPHSRLMRAAWHGLDAFNPGGYRLVRQAIAEVKPDLLFTDLLAGISASAWLAGKHAGVPVLQRVCDAYLVSPSLTALFAPAGSAAGMARKLLRWPHAGLSRSLTGVVGLSRAIVDLHRAAGLFAGVPVEVIPSALPVAVPVPVRRQGPLRLGFIGQLVPTKGIEALLAGFVAAGIDATLDVAGTGEGAYEAGLRARYGDDPRVRFLGWVGDKARFFGGIDLCVVPSQVFDTLPTVVIEAFAHHVPVLGSPIGGIPEMVTSGRSGFVLPLGSAEAVAAALRGLDVAAVRDMAPGVAAAAGGLLNPRGQIDRWEAAMRRAAAR